MKYYPVMRWILNISYEIGIPSLNNQYMTQWKVRDCLFFSWLGIISKPTWVPQTTRTFWMWSFCFFSFLEAFLLAPKWRWSEVRTFTDSRQLDRLGGSRLGKFRQIPEHSFEKHSCESNFGMFSLKDSPHMSKCKAMFLNRNKASKDNLSPTKTNWKQNT